MRLDIAIHVEMDWEQDQPGVFGEGPGDNDRPDEQWGRWAEGRRGVMFRRQSETQISYADNKNDHGGWPPLPPVFSEDEERDPEERKNEAGFLAQSAQEKEQAAGNKEERSPGARGRQRSKRAVKSQKSEGRRERIGPAGNVGHGCVVDRMDCPDERREESQPACFRFLDGPQAQQLPAAKQQRERRPRVAEDTGEMIARRLEDEGGIIEQIGQSLNGTIKIRRRGVDK